MADTADKPEVLKPQQGSNVTDHVYNHGGKKDKGKK